MMNRTACLELLKTHITDEIVVAAYSTASEWIEINDRVLNYFSFGAMGLGSSHALGMAVAFPKRRVVVLDGDGSLLMNLSTLVTIGAVAPRNLVHIVWHNGCYEANGGHQIPNKDTDFCGIARSSGIKKVHKISDMANYERQIGSILKEEGPVFAEMMIAQGPLGARSYTEMYKPERRKAFKDALAG